MLCVTKSCQIPYEFVPTIDLWQHSHDFLIGSEAIKLHFWLLDNVLLDLAQIDTGSAEDATITYGALSQVLAINNHHGDSK